MKPDHLTRRTFLDRTAAKLVAGTLAPLDRSPAVVVKEPRRTATLEEAYKRLGFDPRAGDSFTAPGMADSNYGSGEPEDILPPMENPEQNGSYLTFTIPQSCLDSGSLSLRMTGCAVSGFALIG